jgi:hypothetical protein
MEFQENEFCPTNETLKDLKDKIIKKGLSFHPYLAMQAINQEVETQLRDLIVNHFKGMKVEMLGLCNQEIKEYADAEEARYQAFQRAQTLDPNSVLKGNVTSISSESVDKSTKIVDKTKKKK